MGYPIQFQEHDDEVVEITFRCQQARLLMRPGTEFSLRGFAFGDPALRGRVLRTVGCIGQAIKVSKAPVRVHFGGSESNHAHLIVSASTAEVRSAFKCHLRTNLSKEIGELHDWKEGIFGRRCRDIGVRGDSLEERLIYCAAHGVKSGLIARPTDWPGVQFVRAVTEGVPLKGIWYDRTKLYRALQNWKRRKNPGRRPTLMDFAEERIVELAPLPGFDEGLPPEERQAKWRALLDNTMKAFPPKKEVMGPEKLKGANPHTKPARAKRTPAPKLHTKAPAVRQAWLEKYRAAQEGYGGYVRAVIDGRMKPEDFPRELVPPPWLRKRLE